MSGTPAPPSKCCGFGHRHAQTLLMFFGVTLAYALRVNLSIAIVAMQNNTKYHHDKIKAIHFTSFQKAVCLSSFFVGYTFPQIPAGTFVRKYGSCLLLATAIASSGILTMLTPLATQHGGWIGLTIARICLGMTQGFLYPCVNQHITKWAAPQERSKLFAFAFGGSPVGSIAILPFGGLLASAPGGWPLIFYTSGSLAIIWGIVCGLIGANSPSVHKYISQEERHFIESNQISLSKDDNTMETPWKDIWTSVPVWALLITYLGNIWSFWTLLTLTPTYIHDVLKIDIVNNGMLSALPYICMWTASIVYSHIADFIVNKNLLSLETSRKMWNSLSQYGPAICLILLAFLKTNEVQAITLLTISATLNAGMYVGYLMNPTDLSPNFTGTLIGIANGLSNISAVLGPFISTYIVKEKDSLEKQRMEWRVVFLLAATIFIVGSTVFIVFGSSQVQPWNEPKNKRQKTSQEITRI